MFHRRNRVEPRKGPEPIGEILSRVFTARGWGRKQDRLRLERAWVDAAGPEIAPHTRPNGLRRGVLEVLVTSPVLLQELAHYHKRKLLERLRERLPGTTLTDLRFRTGAE
jgi:predicted nucleic acid-binding Zn ribbon protein